MQKLVKSKGRKQPSVYEKKEQKTKGVRQRELQGEKKKKAYDAALLFRSGIVGNVKCITICHSSCMCQSQARSNENWCHTESRFKIR